MSDRYWVGGTANWDGTAGTKWATTSGGAGGASVPTTNDDVYFDANSGTVTCTLSASGNCRSLNFTGFTGTFAGSVNAINIYGNLVLVSGMTLTGLGKVNFYGTSSFTITTAGKTLPNTEFITTSGTYTLQDAFTSSGLITVTQGTFTTNNFNVTAAALSSNNTNTRTINLGSSTVTLSLNGAASIGFGTSTNLTFNAGTSQINISGTSGGISVDTGVTFYNLAFTTTNPGTRTITGNNTFNNLTVTATSGVNTSQVAITANQTINGTLSTTGTAGNRRVWFRSDTYGVRRTLTVNSAPSLTDADFRDIIVNGTSAPISGTRIGNRGACAGITFDAPKTVYRVGTSISWSADSWSDTSGGTANTNFFPLPQDTAIVDNNTGITTNLTLDSAIGYIGTLNCSSRTTSLPISVAANTTVYGSWTNGSGTSITNTSTLTFSGEGTKTITSAGKTFSCPIIIDAYGGTVELADALNIGSQTLTVTNGTFDTKNYNVTAGAFIANSLSFAIAKLGSSTLSLSGGGALQIINAAILEAGTSQINLTADSVNINSSGITYYNVSFTGTGAGNRTIGGANTFNNLTLNASASGLSQLALFGNQTVNGTLTVAGTSATQRAFVRSDTLGTTRTITANAISANDCDFRDITIAGSAAGASPTRAGDCGGNSGINFPAPKTVYRVGTNTGWADANSWATSSGGTGLTANFPLAQDTAVIDENTALTGALSYNAIYNIGSIDTSTRTTGITLNNNAGNSIYGNYTLGSGVTITGTTTQTFSGRGTQTFTSAGKTITFPIAVDSFSGTFQLGDALTIDSRFISFLSGTFDAVTYNVTARNFSCSANFILKMGSGLWTATGTGAVWTMSASAIFFKGTADILLSDTSTSARTFGGGNMSYNKLTIGGATGTSTTTITGNNQFTELASTKTVAHTIALGANNQTFGAWTVTGSAGNVVTLTGNGAQVLAGSCTSGIDYLDMGSITFGSDSTAEFYAGANSTGTAGAPVYRTAKPADSTRYWVGGTGNWSDTARWSTSSGGAGGASVPRSHDDVVFDSASNATAYTATVNAVTGGIRCKSLTIAPPASGNITLAGAQAIIGIHGDVTLPATGLTRTYSGAIILSGSTTGKTFTTNGVTLASPITVNGVGCGWTLGSALTSDNFSVTNGSFDTGNFNLTCGNLSSNNSNTRSITLGSSTVNSLGNLDFQNSRNLTLNASTSQINMVASNVSVVSTNLTFNNLSFTGTATGARTLQGANTFNNLTLNASATGLSQLSITANQTITGTLTCSGSSAIARGFVRSGTIGTTRTLTVGTLAANDCDFRDITIAGTAAGTAPTRAGDCGGNSGITFPAPKTVYYSVAGTSNWGATTWAFTNGGTADITAFPLAQDTAVFPSSPTPYPSSGNTVTVNFSYNIGTIDMSARTTNTMTLDTGSTTPTVYGNWINGTGTTLTGSSTVTFSGRGTMTFTSAGKTITFPITVDTPTGTFQLGDAFSLNNTLLLTRGTFNAVSYSVTCGVFGSSNSNTRTLSLGSGLWTLAGTGTIWNTGTITGLTFNKDTANILLSNTATSARTFSGGGLSYNKLTIGGATGVSTLTVNGNNTFTEIASTKTVAHTIALGTTTQRVGAFTVTGTLGNVVAITGNTSNLIYTGAGSISGLDYLNIQGRVYGSAGQITDVWYAGANSVNSGSLGWLFSAAPTPPPASNSNFFLLFA